MQLTRKKSIYLEKNTKSIERIHIKKSEYEPQTDADEKPVKKKLLS